MVGIVHTLYICKIDLINQARNKLNKSCNNVIHYFLVATLGNTHVIDELTATRSRCMIRSADLLQLESVASIEDLVM